jgi:hypothetical protein
LILQYGVKESAIISEATHIQFKGQVFETKFHLAYASDVSASGEPTSIILASTFPQLFALLVQQERGNTVNDLLPEHCSGTKIKE